MDIKDTPETPEMADLNSADLYREETITDMAIGAIRAYIPINANGTVDTTRAPKYMANSHVSTPMGPIPVQGFIEGVANTEEALAKFAETISTSLEKMYEEAQKAALAEEAREGAREDDSPGDCVPCECASETIEVAT